MSATEQIREAIEKRLRAIETEVVSLNSALKRLDSGDGAPAPSRNGRGRAKTSAPVNGSRRAGSRRTTAVVSPASLEQRLGKGNGMSTAGLAEQVNADRAQVLAQLKQLEAEGKVRRTGERRSVRWHVITDEDRIRERAAELERRSRKTSRARGRRT